MSSDEQSTEKKFCKCDNCGYTEEYDFFNGSPHCPICDCTSWYFVFDKECSNEP